MPLWWNWQTRGTQNPVVAIPCRFDPDQRHHKEQIKSFDLVCSFFCPKSGENRRFVNMRSIFLPRVPACGIRQSPKGTDRRHHIEQIKSFDLVCSFFCPTSGENRRFVNMHSIFLPKVPACGKRQSPKGTDQRHHIERIKSFDLVCSFFCPTSGGEPKVRQYAQHILAEGSRLRDTATPKGYSRRLLLKTTLSPTATYR